MNPEKIAEAQPGLSDNDFRAEVRTWLERHVPRTPRPADPAGARAWDTDWQRTQFEGGYAGIAWPAEYGGRGLPLSHQLVWYEEYARAGGPDVGCCFVGNNHGGPTLIARGSEAQKRDHLARILDGSEVWCQGFSEPGAGSDLAGVSTYGVVDGDHLVISGQKIWTSYAHMADVQELLIRTDRDAPRHKGLTWVIGDMRAPGVTVRPIKTMDGHEHLCEVFYDEVRVPLTDVVGTVNDGWSVAMSTLGFERGTAFMQLQTELARRVDALIDLAATTPAAHGRGVALDDEAVAGTLAELHADVCALRAMTYAMVSRSARAKIPGPEGSMIKVYYSELNQRIGRATMSLVAVDGLEPATSPAVGDLVHSYLYSYFSTIGGGTSEVQRDIIGERVLGLPRHR
ncbi:acyl-CoA dehydrogenase family protein [Nocardia harenae]|uniref:acyl-CoA dehydrogenase family protein n=1 Tax=Nocardia harenae TaxID=358707 RepID=UPI001FE175B5|nr:acyl-CoA dehydrogenase family protein [Nocardia harenae]